MRRLLTFAMTLSICSLSNATQWTVDDDLADYPKADFTSIQDAINDSADGDEIVVYPGTYTNTSSPVVNMNGKLVHLRSTDPTDPAVVAATIIDGENLRQGIVCNGGETSATIVDGLTIANCYIYVDMMGVRWWWRCIYFWS